MTDPRHNLVWLAPQRVGSTVILHALARDIQYHRGVFRKKLSGSYSPLLNDPDFQRLRFNDPNAAYDIIVRTTCGPSVVKLEYRLFFGGDADQDGWRHRLQDILVRDDVTIVHAWRRDLFRRFASMAYARKTGMMQRPAGTSATDLRVRLNPKHATGNITRMREQARTLKRKIGARNVIHIDYCDIVDRSAHSRLRRELDLPLSETPIYEFDRVIENPYSVFDNYDEARQEVISRLGQWVCDCPINAV